jgi:hypothetical protein
MYDFVSVIWRNAGLRPRFAGKDFQVALHGYSPGLDFQVLEQGGYSQLIRNFPAFPIHCDGHGVLVRIFGLSA